MSEKSKAHYGLGHIYRRGSTWWIQYRVHGKRYRESAESTKRSDAKALLERRLGEHAVGKFAPRAERVTFDDLVQLIKDDYVNRDRKSWDRTERSIKRLRRVFGSDPAVHITDRRIDQYAADRLRDGVARSTVTNELAALKRMFSLAVSKRVLSQRPAFPSFGKLRNARQEFLEDWEYAALKAELPEHLQPVLTFIFWTGWRFKSEVRTLKWDQVDFDRGFVSLWVGTTKNDEGRDFPFSEFAELEETLSAQRALTDELEQRTGRIIPWVFHKSGRQIDANSNGFYAVWNVAAKRAGVTGRDGQPKRPHDCRRSAVRRCERDGMSREIAKRLVGHKTDSMYSRYNIVREDDLKAAVAQARARSEKEQEQPEEAGRNA